jgi:hypothetical protein
MIKLYNTLTKQNEELKPIEDGLVKMYIAEEDNGMLGNISPEEWNDLKLIMRDIIKGAMSNA